MIEEQRKNDESLEDLIREINSTVNKVVGKNSDDESEYIEEEKYPEEIRE